jgi:hypothetical protein
MWHDKLAPSMLILSKLLGYSSLVAVRCCSMGKL